MAHFSSNPSVLVSMIDLQTIRRPQQTFFTGHVKPQHARMVCKRTFDDNSFIEIENVSNVRITVYCSSRKTGLPDDTFATIPARQSMMVNVESLGSLRNH